MAAFSETKVTEAAVHLLRLRDESFSNEKVAAELGEVVGAKAQL